MKALNLTADQTSKLRRAHRLTKNKRAADRIKSVYLISRGKTAREIAEVLMLDEDSIGNYRKRYNFNSRLLKAQRIIPVLQYEDR